MYAKVRELGLYDFGEETVVHIERSQCILTLSVSLTLMASVNSVLSDDVINRYASLTKRDKKHKDLPCTSGLKT